MTLMPTIDFNNIIKYPLIKATEYSEVHVGNLLKPATPSSASIHSASSASSSNSSSSRPDDQDYKPVVLKYCRQPEDFRDLLHAHGKLRDLPQAPNLVVFYGATRENVSNSPTANRSRASSLSSMAFSSLSLSSNPAPAAPSQTSRDWIVTKPSAYGTLHEYLKSPQGESLDWMAKIRLIRGVASGLQHLHEHGLFHMNLHSDNVLVESGPTAVLTDFGQISRSSRGPESIKDQSFQSNTATTNTTTINITSPKSTGRWVHGGGVYEKSLLYTAPERLANPELNPCTSASDIYSLGVIMLEILTGQRSLASQFLTSSDHTVRLSAATPLNSTSPMPTLSTPQGTLTLPTAIESLIRRICARDPAQRPGLLIIRSQLKEMANTSYDLHVREPINKGTTGIQLNAKKPISLISVVTTPSVISESGASTPESQIFSAKSLVEPIIPKSPTQLRHRTSILRKALDMSLNSPPASPRRRNIQIWEAVVKGDTKTINSLLSQGVSVNQRDPVTEHTPLIAAVADLENSNQTPNIPVLELLINRGAEINAFDNKTKQTILHHLCSRPTHSPAVLKFLLDRGANPNAVSAARQTPLHYLAERSKTSPLEMMRLLLDFGAEVDTKGPVMWTALHLLCSSEKPYLDAMMLLLTRDVDVNAKDSNQWTALHFVAHYNQDPAPALKILVDAGANVNALTKRHEGIIQILLKSKSIDRLAALDLLTYAPAGANANANGPPAAASSGLGIVTTGMLGQFGGGHNRRKSTASNLSIGGTGVTRIGTVTENNALSPALPEGDVLLSPEEEVKEESLKKLADIIRWLIIDCGANIEQSLEFEDPYPPAHPKNQHILYRAIRLGMRPIVAVLLETSLVMSETYVLDEALQVTEEMLTVLNQAIQPQNQHGNENGAGRTSNESLNSTYYQSRRRRNSSVSSNGSVMLGGGYGGNGLNTNNGTTNIITPKSLAVAAASINRIQEIEALLKVWRFSEQREQLLDSVKARLARSNRRRASNQSGRYGHGDDDSSLVGGGSPVSSISSEREREIFIRSITA
ncbi:hypothetical protein BGZ76_007740 [Entomortierella beljakovae]|nr:hypothetical protein BGZ76_007740 [Entomortierella beljakovae]